MTDTQKMINDLVKKGFNLRQISEAIGVPLMHDEHTKQHNEGESALGGREFFDKQLVKFRQLWIKSILYQCFSVDSLSDIDVNDFLALLDKKGIKDTVPASAMGSV